MRRELLDSGAAGRFLYDLPQHLRRHAFAPYAAGLVDRAEHRAFGNSGGSAPDVNRGLDPLRDGTVRICPALPFRSVITQCSSRTWMESIAKDRSSPRRRPQPISIARMA